MSPGTFMPWDQVATIVLLFSSSQFSVDPDQFNDTVNTAKFINYKMTVEKKVYILYCKCICHSPQSVGDLHCRITPASRHSEAYASNTSHKHSSVLEPQAHRSYTHEA